MIYVACVLCLCTVAASHQVAILYAHCLNALIKRALASADIPHRLEPSSLS